MKALYIGRSENVTVFLAATQFAQPEVLSNQFYIALSFFATAAIAVVGTASALIYKRRK